MLGHRYVRGQRGPAERPQVNLDDDVAHHPSRLGHSTGGLQLDRVTLAVAKRDGVRFIALALGDGKGRGRVQAA